MKHEKDIIIVIFFSPHPQKTQHTEALLLSMDSFLLQNSVYHNMSSINNAYMTPDLSHGLDDTSSVSQSPTTSLHNRLLSIGNFSHGSANASRTLGSTFSYKSSIYMRNLQNKCQ